MFISLRFIQVISNYIIHKIINIKYFLKKHYSNITDNLAEKDSEGERFQGRAKVLAQGRRGEASGVVLRHMGRRGAEVREIRVLRGRRRKGVKSLLFP